MEDRKKVKSLEELAFDAMSENDKIKYLLNYNEIRLSFVKHTNASMKTQFKTLIVGTMIKLPKKTRSPIWYYLFVYTDLETNENQGFLLKYNINNLGTCDKGSFLQLSFVKLLPNGDLSHIIVDQHVAKVPRIIPQEKCKICDLMMPECEDDCSDHIEYWKCYSPLNMDNLIRKSDHIFFQLDYYNDSYIDDDGVWN